MLLVKVARGYSVIGARRKVASRIGVLFAEVWCDEGGKAGREKAGREKASREKAGFEKADLAEAGLAEAGREKGDRGN